MDYSTRIDGKVFNPLRSDVLTRIKNIPTWFCYLSSLIVILICKAVKFKRRLVPAVWF